MRNVAINDERSGRRRRTRTGLAHGLRRSACALALVFGAASAFADEAVHRLSVDGARLGTLFTDGPVDDLRFTVALDGDVPSATHVWAVIGAAYRRQRTNDGYWVPWNGDPDSLIDNHFPVIDDRVVFKVLDEDIGADNMGVTISVGYRSGDVLKYGIFGIIPNTVGQ